MEELLTISPIKQITIVLISLVIITSFVGQWSSAIAQNQEINLIGQQNIWKPFGRDTTLSQNNTDLNIIVKTDNNGKLWNRAFLPTQINSTTNKSSILNLDYGSRSFLGNATFFAEIRGKNNSILWSSFLNNTNGLLSNGTFTLPNHILNLPIEFRLYLAT